MELALDSAEAQPVEDLAELLLPVAEDLEARPHRPAVDCMFHFIYFSKINSSSC